MPLPDTGWRWPMRLRVARRTRCGSLARPLQRNPDYVPAYQMSAQELLKAGRSDEARERLQAGLAACERSGNTHAASEMQAMLDELG